MKRIQLESTVHCSMIAEALKCRYSSTKNTYSTDDDDGLQREHVKNLHLDRYAKRAAADSVIRNTLRRYAGTTAGYGCSCKSQRNKKARACSHFEPARASESCLQRRDRQLVPSRFIEPISRWFTGATRR